MFIQALAVGLAVIALSTHVEAAEPADLILHHGKIFTADATNSIASGMAGRGERIVAVGTDESVLAHRGPVTLTMLDFGGGTTLRKGNRHQYTVTSATFACSRSHPSRRGKSVRGSRRMIKLTLSGRLMRGIPPRMYNFPY